MSEISHSAADHSVSAASTAMLPVTLLAWRPMVKGALRGFATIQLGRSLKIADVSVFSSNGKLWASFPSKPLIGEGKALLDEHGKQRYAPFMEWLDKQTADRFSAAVVAAVQAGHGPEALA
jgi:hypothetical protein